MRVTSLTLIPGLGRLLRPRRCDLPEIVWRELKRRGEELRMPLALGAQAAEVPPLRLPSGRVSLILSDDAWEAVFASGTDLLSLQREIGERLEALQVANCRRFLWAGGRAPEVEIHLGDTGRWPWRLEVQGSSRAVGPSESVGALEIEGRARLELRPGRIELPLLGAERPLVLLVAVRSVSVRCPRGLGVSTPGTATVRRRMRVEWGGAFEVIAGDQRVSCRLEADPSWAAEVTADDEPTPVATVPMMLLTGWRVPADRSWSLQIGPPGSEARLRVTGLTRTSAVDLEPSGDGLEVRHRQGKVTVKGGSGLVDLVTADHPVRRPAPFTLTLDGRVRMDVVRRGGELLIQLAEKVEVQARDGALVAGPGAWLEAVTLADDETLGRDGYVTRIGRKAS